ncbi:MAG: HypC/HybG/HupF family hydrogenase formation chaperone [Nanoarchaeota archaeon]|nr:HypC/HybG/HupF family hydrogenase formation chaperone [Nanoarchaeota archaeon]
MCLSIPGKVIEISKNRYIIKYPNEKRVVNLSIIDDLEIGDYVIVSNKIIITKIPEKDAKKFFELVGG